MLASIASIRAQLAPHAKRYGSGTLVDVFTSCEFEESRLSLDSLNDVSHSLQRRTFELTSDQNQRY